MKNTIPAICCALLVTAFSASPIQASPAGTGGGFTGPGLSVISAAQAREMRDDTNVTLRGNIVRHLGGEDYLFQDASGTIQVEIDQHKWAGQNIAPGDVVTLHGEVDKDFFSVKVDVEQVVKE